MPCDEVSQLLRNEPCHGSLRQRRLDSYTIHRAERTGASEASCNDVNAGLGRRRCYLESTYVGHHAAEADEIDIEFRILSLLLVDDGGEQSAKMLAVPSGKLAEILEAVPEVGHFLGVARARVEVVTHRAVIKVKFTILVPGETSNLLVNRKRQCETAEWDVGRLRYSHLWRLHLNGLVGEAVAVDFGICDENLTGHVPPRGARRRGASG